MNRSWFPTFTSVLALIVCYSEVRADDQPTAEQLEFFESKIRPVLIEHCYECHSGDQGTPKGGLRLDLKASILEGGDSGTALIAGKPNESILLQAMRYEGLEMPPKGKLPANIIADFEHWIQNGAADPRTENAARKPTGIDYAKGLEFWAFQPPVRKPLPDTGTDARVFTDVDRFVLQELDKHGLKPSPLADRRTLIRRVYFDLTGLPPEPEAVDAFVNDPSPDAYAKLVDQLLASPHYGERWGRYWLDLARFAEDQAHTFQARMYPQGYLYRDWVIKAFNDDMPYDQFLRLQIAGDLLEMPDAYQHRPALGLFALGPVYYQDNGEQEKAQADEWDDRIDTLMRGTQALTASCARCHDHKYDPISMSDYYGLAGVFASSAYREVPSVSDDIVASRSRADRAVQEKQLEIDRLRMIHAPQARQKLLPSLPEYLRAAVQLLKNPQPNRKKKSEELAKSSSLNAELIQRCAAWLAEEKNSGALHLRRDYLAEWRAARASIIDGSAETASQTEAVNTVATQLQAKAESLLPLRESLRKQFGEQFAFVSVEDRAVVVPGIIPLGNLFDDRKGASLSSALMTDPFRFQATPASLGVDRVAYGWGGSTEIAAGVQFDFASIGSDSRRHGAVTNDGWSDEGGIQTLGKRCSPAIGRTEQGIGMHANALITFNLNELRRAGLIPASETMTFKVDRAGINDDSFGVGSTVHIAVIVSRPQSKPSEFDSIIAAYLDGKPAPIEENDAVYSFSGPMPPAIGSDGRFVSFDISLPPESTSVTIAVTGAQISDADNTISSDHAVLSNVRIEYPAAAVQVANQDSTLSPEQLSEDERKAREDDAALLSELFDDRGILGLPTDQIDPLLEGDVAAQLNQHKQTLADLKTAADAIRIPVAHSLTEGTLRDVPVYIAGDPHKKGPIAERSFPVVLTAGQREPFQSKGSGRLELANAIASRNNPLTARVIANRIWAGHFGQGLVRTLSNFGQLGERPTHPELLDYLAVELMENGWSLKKLHRTILLSATYQQTSDGNAANSELDPENRFLWKMNRRRLEVEPWRDSLLAVSGQLVRELGGPSSELDGGNRRRTIYGAVSRHRLNDLLRLFDFPDPNITSGERSVTTVPLQQLFVLNSDFMVNQSRALAERLNREASSDDGRVDRLFALLFGRKPTDDEKNAAMGFLQSKESDPSDRLSRLEQFCLAMLGTNEFAYVD
ncbi:MAG: DUF1553 domain-containing protein [Planctomycetaceae bacterium]|nr:DUF1553 domain-containing protein [Planctomycetaceae bacterium]